MEFNTVQGKITELQSQCLVLGVFKDQGFQGDAAGLDGAGHSALDKLLESRDISPHLGKTTLIHAVDGFQARRLLIIGCGDSTKFDQARFSKVCHSAGKVLRNHPLTEALSCLHQMPVIDTDLDWRLRHGAVTIANANYLYTATKPLQDDSAKPLTVLNLLSQTSAAAVLDQIRALKQGFDTAKELGNLPPNICNPAYLAQQSTDIAQRYSNCSIEILNAQEMADLGMDALLGVARGSRNDPKLIVLRYQGAAEDQAPVALVGKGVTFDSGGISIKPSQHMDQMKYDMCGAAAVIGAFETCAQLQLRLNLVTVVAAVENMPDGAAYRPGDVITSMSGQTIEIINTDAEGRLILADAMTYVERFAPAAVIDVATLTGACVIALGHHATGLMSNNDALAEELARAGQASVDRAWRMPLWEEYQSQLDTPFADMKNVGGMPAGSITAGCFLSRFAENMAWAHLDSAGSAWKWASQEGATGRPVGLLAEFLLQRETGPAA